MSEWLGKPRIDREEVSKWLVDNPYFGSVARWFLDVNKVHVDLIVPDEVVEKLEEKMVEKYGSISAGNLRRICLDAIKEFAMK